MKLKEKFMYNGYEITFEHHANRKCQEYTSFCQYKQEPITRHDDTLEGAKRQMINYIDNIPEYKHLYENK
ncbi:hypothetical protein G9F71_013620 [Clostridium sp. FP2]|uniref:hypothetical protein n=1 Tax=Clostridium TaxID=1485 RepID=UPI0013E93AF6|nr:MULTISPECIES: hypothetical protein [Clostridium]MBW9157808.1 hypothetical protein [Clostridium tagluense]MBZ9623885.1 hypothetical protein [Clostridium sp. FP2]WLC63783.1 hypothetical protein KTC93_12905 [Clostridium tagluense]